MKLGNIFKQVDSSDISSISTNINANTSSNTNTEINWKQRGVNAAGLAQGKVIAYEANLTAEVWIYEKTASGRHLKTRILERRIIEQEK